MNDNKSPAGATPPPIDMEATWQKLEAMTVPGTHMLRLHPLLNFNATITQPDEKLGLLFISTEPLQLDESELVGSQQISVDHQLAGDETSIHLQLEETSSKEMFLTLCSDLVPRVTARDSDAAAATTLVRRFSAWQHFLKRSGSSTLSKSRQQGLFGELVTFRDLMVPAVGPVRAVSAWSGPLNTPQDFQASGIAIEVKTIVHSEPQTLRIDGERQLDDFGVSALVIAHHRVFRHQDSGQSLPAIVEEVRALVAEDEGPIDDFDNLLLAYGYNDADREHYVSHGFSVRETKHYRVQPGFPRLTESDLRPGVGALAYSVDASACERFSIDAQDVAAWFTAPPEIVDPAETAESVAVEYKQTAWTPTTATNNDEHHKSVVAELKKAVVKTVVAFLNTDGGELVIGVRDDDRAVTGIEPDLASRGRPTNDTDFYERELVALFSEYIDAAVHSQLRIRFEKKDAGTTCHINVRRSPSPRFGRSPAGGKKDPVFWIRAGSQTDELKGQNLATYIVEHWS